MEVSSIKKRISAFLLCAVLLTSVSPARALDAYSVNPDTVPFKLTASAYDVALTEVSQTELDVTLQKYLVYDGDSAAWYLSQLYNYLATVRNALVVPGSSNTPFWSTGAYLAGSGDVVAPSVGEYFSVADLVRRGFVGLEYEFEQIKSILAVVDEHIQVDKYGDSLSDIITDLGDIYAGLGGVKTAVQQVGFAVSSVESAVDSVKTSVDGLGVTMTDLITGTSSPFVLESATILGNNGQDFTPGYSVKLDYIMNYGFRGLASLLRVDSGIYQLDRFGNVVTSTSVQSISSIMRQGFMGLASQQREAVGYVRLDRTGKETVSDQALTVTSIMRQGLLGIRSLVSGSEADNVYSGSLVDNENKTSTFEATGLGPMLNKYLGEIQNDTGILSYVFASPVDLEMKENSEENMESVNDSFLASDSKSGVKANNISDLSDASESIQALGQTGVTPSQAFDQIGSDASIFSLFTAEAAADLDSASYHSTLMDADLPVIVTDYYNQSREEFYSIIAEGSGD